MDHSSIPQKCVGARSGWARTHAEVPLAVAGNWSVCEKIRDGHEGVTTLGPQGGLRRPRTCGAMAGEREKLKRLKCENVGGGRSGRRPLELKGLLDQVRFTPQLENTRASCPHLDILGEPTYPALT